MKVRICRSASFLILLVVSGCATQHRKNSNLLEAIALKDSEKVEAALKSGANPNAEESRYDDTHIWYLTDTPLTKAVTSGDIKTAAVLLNAGADPNSKYLDYLFGEGLHRTGNSLALALGAGRGLQPNLEMVRLLLGKGADPNSKICWEPGDKCNQYVQPYAALEFALDQEANEIVRLLLEKGADPNARFKEGTALGRAVEGGDPGIVKLLLEKGANLSREAVSKAGQHPEILKLLDDLRASEVAVPEKAGDDSAKAGRSPEAISQYSKALSLSIAGTKSENRIREKVIALVIGLPEPPEVPEEARRRTARAQAAVESAKNEADYRAALAEFQQASLAAPWLPSPYYNMAVIQEKLKDYPGAISNLELYLQAAPTANDTRAVRDKVYKLEMLQEKAGK